MLHYYLIFAVVDSLINIEYYWIFPVFWSPYTVQVIVIYDRYKTL